MIIPKGFDVDVYAVEETARAIVRKRVVKIEDNGNDTLPLASFTDTNFSVVQCSPALPCRDAALSELQRFHPRAD